MTYTPDLNISGSPIYENLVATSGDPYQPPAYQVPALFQPPDASGAYSTEYGADHAAEYGQPAYAYGSPAMLSQFLNRIFGDGQSWVAVVVFGGPMADQLRQYQQFPQFQQSPQPQMPQPFWPGAPSDYADASGFGGGAGLNGMGADQAAMAQAFQAYQQMMMYQWAAQQQAMQQQAAQQQVMPQAMMPGQQPLALTAGPAMQSAELPLPMSAPDPSDQAAMAYGGGMVTEDWAGWLGQTSQSVRPQPLPQDVLDDDQEARYEPSYERRGGRLSSRLGAAMRELRGR